MFAIYKPVVFLSNDLNLSTDILQHARFRRERRQSRNCLPSTKLDDHTRPNGSKPSPLSGRLSHLLRYHDNGFLCLLFTILRLSANILGLISQSMYCFLPLDRDPLTDDYLNPMLRTMERMFIYNYFDQCHIFNKLFALHLLQTMLMYSRNVHLKIKNSQINRFKYEEVNIVQVDIAFAHEIYSNLRGWFSIMLSLGQHECRTRSYLQSERGKAMKSLSEKLKKSDKIDRLYYYNQIEFDDCYKSWDIHVRTQSQETGKSRDNQDFRWYDHLLYFNLPGRRMFAPEPGHRMDPIEMSILLIFYVAGTAFVLILVVIGYLSYFSLCEASHVKSRLLTVLIGNSLFFVPIAMNSFDCGLVCFCSLLRQSRARKLTNMLATEMEAYRSLVEVFWLTVGKYNEQTSCRGESNLNFLAEHSRARQDCGPKYNSTSTDYHVCSLICIRNNHEASRSSVPDQIEHSLLEDSIDNFKRHIGERRLQEINSNISYLLNILSVLQNEHSDLRKNFTNYLNMNLIFSIPCLAFSFTVITTLASSLAEIYLALVLACVSSIPMVICMFLGATSERSVSSTRIVLMQRSNYQLTDLSPKVS